MDFPIVTDNVIVSLFVLVDNIEIKPERFLMEIKTLTVEFLN